MAAAPVSARGEEGVVQGPIDYQSIHHRHDANRGAARIDAVREDSKLDGLRMALSLIAR